jgi:ABC-type spermidine/putrescine transport system permease subunit II
VSNLTDPYTYLNSGTGHMIAGGLVVLVFAPISSHFLGFPYGFLSFLSLTGLAVLSGLTREVYQAFTNDTDFKTSITNVAQWAFGGLVFSTFIALAIYFERRWA